MVDLTDVKNNPFMQPVLEHYQVIRRNGQLTAFNPNKIALAMTKAFLAVSGQSVLPTSTRELIVKLTQQIISNLVQHQASGASFHIELIQDQVELALMRSGEHHVARAYVLYREERAKKRLATTNMPTIHIVDQDKTLAFAVEKFSQTLHRACQVSTEYETLPLHSVNFEYIAQETLKNLYDGASLNQVYDCAILATRTLIERDPVYSFIAARILLHRLRREIFASETFQDEMHQRYASHFEQYIRQGVAANLLNPKLLQVDLAALGQALRFERDLQFNYLGLQILYDRYFIALDDKRIEMPQAFFMRIALGLALNEKDIENQAIKFYDLLSRFDFMSSTPTLFNSGTRHAQLSSCYLTTIPDDLSGIYEGLKENALLSKFSGGLGNDWTNVRALGSYIAGTNGKSQGLVPFLKVANDTAVAVNQGGKRKGAVCAYLETWHLDIEEFLELRKNTGDERRRTHDMNTANWIPDLFMKRVFRDEEWTLFSPSSCPDLHSKYGQDFETAYRDYEARAARGEIKFFKKISAIQLWRKMLGMLFETGHPWITFKDPCNIRSPQQHVGVVHSSNLCTEITLNTNENEIAVCNLGSVNLAAHLHKNESGAWVLNHEKLAQTIRTAIRMLDNVIDLNYYAVAKAEHSNVKHRPIGLGIMGFQDCLYQLRLPYTSDAALDFADTSMEAVCYYAYLASTELAEERGPYSSYPGSLWDQNILPQDTLEKLHSERGGYVEWDDRAHMDWDFLRARIQKHGMRNSNCVAIAPTATIANIVGVTASIEPTFQNLYVKSNLSGEFTVINEYLVEDLKALQLWNDAMVADLKYFDGDLEKIENIPNNIKHLYTVAFKIPASSLVRAAARRQKWIDQAQSLNIYVSHPSGKKLDEIYKLAWKLGLKTTYYLRTVSASYAEKSTVNLPMLNAVQQAPTACNFNPNDEEGCEVCQ